MSSLPSSPESDTQTPSSIQQPSSSAILSPPDSQHRTMPISPTGLSGANSNGKRPINTISNGPDDELLNTTQQTQTLPSLQASSSTLSSSQANGMSKTRLAQGQPPPPSDFPPKVHERSGYTWDREEDAPGYAWLNKKAVEEYGRALESLVGREGGVVGARYPDPFEMVEKERAVKESMK